MPATRNYTHSSNTEFEGVEVSLFTVDFINPMTNETGDPAANSSLAGLELTRNTIGNYINILGEGPLFESDKQKTYTVRADAVGTLISGGTLQAAIRALNGLTTPGVTATISSATVTAKDMEIAT